MTDITIRIATPDDFEIIADFNCRLAWESEHLRLDPPTVRKGVHALLSNPKHGRYFVAMVEGRIVGQVMHTFEWSDWRNGMYWWLQSVFVAEEFRGRGIFRRLFEHVVAEARQDGNVTSIRLYVERDNHRAHHAYHALGLTDAGYFVMERSFVDAAPPG